MVSKFESFWLFSGIFQIFKLRNGFSHSNGRSPRNLETFKRRSHRNPETALAI
jgi:hypothetical protein